jgi:hypothetical protein
MVTAAYLSFTVAMVVVLLLAWRLRADAVEALARAEADARRGRHAQALAADMANIAQGLVLSLEVIDPAQLTGPSAEALADAHGSVMSFAETLRAAQYLVQTEPMHVKGRAEGWVRVAVAGARGEGVGVRVGGFSTDLRVEGRSHDIARILDGVVQGLGATLPPKGYVQVDLLPEGVDVSAPVAEGRVVDPRVARAAAIAGLVSWTLTTDTVKGLMIVRIGPARPADEPESDALVPVSRRLDA